VYTQCIECLTIYRVAAEQLKLGLGEMRCGHCGHVFNALLTIVEHLPETAIDELPRAQVDHLPPTLDLPVMHASKQKSLFSERSVDGDDKSGSSEWLSFTPAEATLDLRLDDLAGHQFRRNAFALDETQANNQSSSSAERGRTNNESAIGGPVDAFSQDKNARYSGRTDATDTPKRREWGNDTSSSLERGKHKDLLKPDLGRPRNLGQDPFTLRDPGPAPVTFSAPGRAVSAPTSRVGLWLALSALLIGVLSVQLIHLQWARLEQHPSARPVLAWFCQYANCKLAFQSNFEKFSLLDRDVKPHPSAKGALMISATVRNDATFAQTFPVVEVRLLDISRNLVAARRFFPSEYLQDETIQPAGFPADSTLPIIFEVLDPGSSAVNFEFAFLPPVNTAN
jgi:predicted Zn finger-like uncharacterized protein